MTGIYADGEDEEEAVKTIASLRDAVIRTQGQYDMCNSPLVMCES